MSRLARLASSGIALLLLTSVGCAPLRSEYYDPPDRPFVDQGQLRLQGYYAREWIYYDANVLSTLMLWDDGTAAVFTGPEGPCGRDKAEQEDYSFQAQHRRFREDLRCVTGERRQREPAWGVFATAGDSIEIHVITYLDYGGAGEYRPLLYRGVIIDDSTFIITMSEAPGYAPPEDVERTFRFYPLEEKPPSTNWTQTHPALQ